MLLDENLPGRLIRLLEAGVEATIVGRRGWKGKKNGELLAAAEKEFDAFLTADRHIPDQQDLSSFEVAVVILEAPSNAYLDLAPLMERVNVELGQARPGLANPVRVGAYG